MTHVHAFTDDALGELDAVALAEAVKAGRVTGSEVVDAAIARTESVNPALGGLACQAFDQARAKVSERGRDGGFFAGVPTFIKDCVGVAGLPTKSGSDAWVPHRPAADSKCTRLYLASGLISLGKTQMPELGLAGTAEHPRLGAVRNPWHTEYTAGGSSSGSAALVAAGAVPIAHGNDGGGSVRLPASCTGLVGLKPSRGRLPLDDRARIPVHLLVNGVLTRSVRDTAAFYREIERDWRHPTLPPIGDVKHPGRQRLRIGVVTRSDKRECSPEVRELTMKTASLLEQLGHRVDHVEKLPIPSTVTDDFVLYWALLARWQVKGIQRAFGDTFDRNRLTNLTRGLDHYARHNLHRLPAAILRLRAVRRRTARFFEGYDVVLSPTTADATPRLGCPGPTADAAHIIDRGISWNAFAPLANITGEPAISLPLAETANGMPIGMMLSADLGREALLLELALELEEARPFTRIADG
ncbi:amidase [Mycobacterium sp. ACS1612]|uniref:amidase n=1 Tax=Mycobacterium sp. ACS1612 TaxID=1834117 RepID=UPI0007FF2037|nr:amidase [Mycobacterium sp. ACS1612]OBF28936.1 amidase [Mycobacterium sp. ACS1612]